METENIKCALIGHQWRSTTSDRVQVCTCEGCQAVKRLYRGAWIVQERSRAHRKTQLVARQTSLFSQGE